jgi:hypothetical protein
MKMQVRTEAPGGWTMEATSIQPPARLMSASFTRRSHSGLRAEGPAGGDPAAPKLTACGDPARDQAVAVIMARLLKLPRRSVVLAEDETHLHLPPHVQASWTLRGIRPPRSPRHQSRLKVHLNEQQCFVRPLA